MKKIRLLSVLLAMLTILGMFASCGNEPVPVETTEETTVAETEPPVSDVVIAQKDLCEYKVVRPEKMTKETQTFQCAIELRQLLAQKYGCNPQIAEDWYNKNKETLPETAKEILVGTTNRIESQNALSSIREKDFIIKYENERLLIMGGCDEATARAYEYFVEHFINVQADKLVIQDNLNLVVKYDYLYSTIKIDGVNIADYTVVYPQNADRSTKCAAMNLVDLIQNYAGVTLNLTTDKSDPVEYELLVETTNRTESVEASKTTLANDEFLLCKTGKKIVMLGKDYMCAGAAGKLINVCCASTGINCDVDAKNIPSLTEAKPEKPDYGETKNVILMIGDGMGRNQVLATIANGVTDEWLGDKFPGQAYCVTASRSVLLGKAKYTDSAASATALATGYKTINGYIGVDEYKKTLYNVRELANYIGAKTSIITTDLITGATPSAFICHDVSRDSTDVLQSQIDKCIADGKIQYCAGSLGDKLFDNVRDSLQLISDNNSRFFTMIEEAFPDKGGHAGNLTKAMTGVARLNECVAYAATFTLMHPGTALIVTADHETGGLTLNNGVYEYTVTTHSNADVPVYGIGAGVEEFLKSGKVDNTDISRFIAKAYGRAEWGKKY